MNDLLFLESFKKMPLMNLQVRSVVAKLKNAVVLVSPGSGLTAAQLKRLPTVTDIIAPSLLHTAGVPHAGRVFPTATIWATTEVKAGKPDLMTASVLSEDLWPYSEELAAVLLKGMPKVEESIFIHIPSKTLIATDLVFNIRNTSGLGAWFILNFFGTYRKFAMSKFFARFVVDKAAFEKSLTLLFSYDFDRIVMSHGEIVPSGGRQLLLDALKSRGFRPE